MIMTDQEFTQGQMSLTMEDRITDIRNGMQIVHFLSDKNVTEEGYFMTFAKYEPSTAGTVGIVFVILDKRGKVCYRDPKSVKFIFK